MQIIYLLFKLDLQNLRDYEGSEIYLAHRLQRTLQQPKAKTITPTSSDKQ